MLLIALFLGCGGPPATTDLQMVGVVRDAEGSPLSGVSMQTVEARALTDQEGRFTVAYKEPSTYVDFRQGSSQFQRPFREADRGTVVEIELPELRDPELVCDVPSDCTALLTWKFDSGLVSRMVARCTPGQRLQLQSVPAGVPEASCQSNIQLPTEEAWFHDTHEELVLGGPSYPIRAEVRGASDCEVFVGPKQAEPIGQGWYEAPAHGHFTLRATCNGRPATPGYVRARPGIRVSMDWSSTGPSLDLEPAVPWADAIWLHSDKGWAIPIAAGSDGTFALPHLNEGGYTVTGQVDGDARDLAGRAPKTDAIGTLVLESFGSPEDGFSGRFVLDRPLEDGLVPVAP